MSKRSYYWRWIKTAFWRAPGPIDLWSGIAGAILNAVAHFMPAVEAAMSNLTWQLPLWIAGAIVLARLILAPFWMAREDAERITRLEDEKGDAERRNRAKDLLGRYFARGHGLYPAESSVSPDPRAEAWMDDVQLLIKEMFGIGESSLFLSNAGYTFWGGGKHHNRLEGRLRRLSSLIERFERLSLSASFDPEKWEARFVER